MEREADHTEHQDTIRTLPVLALRERVILPLNIPSKPPLWAGLSAESIGK